MGAVIEVGVLGPLEIAVDGRPFVLGGQKQRVLFCRLFVDRGQVVPAWRLRNDVWDGHDGADGVLKTAVSRLRSALGPGADALRREATGYSLARGDVTSDDDRFSALVAEARAATDRLVTVELYDRALALWRGDPFADLPDQPFLRGDVERLQRERELAEEERFEALLAAGRGADLVSSLQAALATKPSRERVAVLLAHALYRAGHPMDALDTLRRTERYLRDEFGLTPSTSFRRFEYRVLTHDATLLGADEPRPEAAPPSSVADDPRVRLDALGRAADALARSGAPSEAARVAARSVDAARSLGDEQLLVRALARLARLLSLAERGADAAVAVAEATDLARRCGDGAGLALIALVKFGQGVASDDPDQLLADLAEPLALLPDDAPECVDLLCASAHQLLFTTDSVGADALIQRAETLAARIGDPRAMAAARAARAILSPIRGEAIAEVERHATEALDAANASGDPLTTIAALHAHVRALTETGRVDDVAALLDDFTVAARQSQFPFAWVRARLLANMVDLARGDLDGIEGRVADALALGTRMGVASVQGTSVIQFGLCWLEQCRYGEIVAIARSRIAEHDIGPWHGLLPFLLALAGERAEASAMVRDLVAKTDDPTIGVDWTRPFMHAYLAEAAVELGLATEAATVAERMRPYAGRCLVLGHASGLYGPADRIRGLALVTAGRADEAVAVLDAAHDQARAGGARLWADRTALGLSTALAARCLGNDVSRAAALVDQVERAGLAAASPRLARELALARAVLCGDATAPRV